MNTSNNKKPAKKGGIVPLLVVLAIAFSAVGELDEDALIPIVGVAVFIAVIAVIVSMTVKAVQKNTPTRTGASRGASPSRSAARPVSRPAVRAGTGTEEAIHCQHKTGREKYLDQLDSFLANGIIDRAEYRILRERYSKLEIDEDYHG